MSEDQSNKDQSEATPPAQSTQTPPVLDYGASDEIALPNPMVLAAIGLALLSIITFLPTLRGEATWLDDVSFTDNPYVHATDGVARFWTTADQAGRYQPMTLTSFWLGTRLFHESLPAEHFINILLHAIVVILLWTVLRRLEVPGAWFAAAVFAVHPVHTQAIAWISGRSVVLAAVFYLAAMLVYLRFLGLTPAAEAKTLFTLPPEPERLWGLAFVLFICALLSNAAAAVTFPIALLLVVWWKRDAISPKEWLGILPFFVVAVAVGAWAGWLQQSSMASEALLAAFGFTPFGDRLLIGLRAIWFYALKIVAPFPLIFDYPRWSSSVGIGALCGLLLVAALVLLWSLRGRWGRGALAGAFLFLVAIVPMLSLLDPPAIRYSFVADNRQYLASAALIALVAAWATRIFASEKLRTMLNPSYCGGAVIVVLAVLSLRQGNFYLNSQSLWRQTIADNADSVLGDEQYADHLLSIGKFDAARDWYEHAQALAPRDPGAMLGLGTVAAAQGFDDSLNGHPELAGTQQTRASQYFQDAIHLDADYGPAYIALARLLTWKKDNVGAVDALTNAVRIDPNNLRARLDLGGAQRRAGDLKGAEDTLTTLLIDAPNVAAVHSELGDVYIQEHKRQEALAEWQRASQLDPNNTTVLLNFGALLDSSGEPELAAKQFQAATIVDPSLAVAHFDLAHVYTKLGHRQDAVDELTKAVALEPNNPHVTDAYARAVEDENKKGPGTPATSQPATAADGDAISAPASQPAGGGDLGKP